MGTGGCKDCDSSYSYDLKSDNDKCEIAPEALKQIKQEESIGNQDRHRSFLSRSNRQSRLQFRSSRNGQSSSSSSSSESNESTQLKQTRQPKKHQQLREHNNQVCVAQEKLTVCPHPYTPHGGDSRPVKFLCLQKSSSHAQELKKQVKKYGSVDLDQYKPHGQRQVLQARVNPQHCQL